MSVTFTHIFVSQFSNFLFNRKDEIRKWICRNNLKQSHAMQSALTQNKILFNMVFLFNCASGHLPALRIRTWFHFNHVYKEKKTAPFKKKNIYKSCKRFIIISRHKNDLLQEFYILIHTDPGDDIYLKVLYIIMHHHHTLALHVCVYFVCEHKCSTTTREQISTKPWMKINNNNCITFHITCLLVCVCVCVICCAWFFRGFYVSLRVWMNFRYRIKMCVCWYACV